MDAWCGSRWRLSAGPAAGRKVRVFGLSGRRQLPVSPAPAPGGAAAAWWSLPCPPHPPSPRTWRGALPVGGPRSPGHPCRRGRPGPHPFSAGVPGPAHSPFGSCVAAALTAAPGFAPTHRSVLGAGSQGGRLEEVAVLSLGEKREGLDGDGCPWGSQVPLGFTAARLPGGPLPSLVSSAPLPSPAVPPTAPLPQPACPCCDGRIPGRQRAPWRGLRQSAWCPRHTGRAVTRARDPWPIVSLVTGVTGEAPAWAAGRARSG